MLYLRADGGLGPGGRGALAAAFAALARIPGASIAIYIEPLDRDGASLAEALAELPDENARRALLLALHEQDLPRWADATALARLGRQVGLTLRGLRGGPRLPFGVVREGARDFLRRPPGLGGAARPFFVAAGLPARALTAADVDALAAEERWPQQLDAADALPARAGVTAIGDPLAPHLVVVRAAAPFEGAARAALVAVRPPVEDGRARLRIELDVDRAASARGADALLDLGLRDATQAQRLQLLTALAAEPSPSRDPAPEDDARAVWLLQAAGIDPEPLWRERAAAPAAAAPLPSTLSSLPIVTLDGAGTFALDLERRVRSPSLRQRLALPSRP